MKRIFLIIASVALLFSVSMLVSCRGAVPDEAEQVMSVAKDMVEAVTANDTDGARALYGEGADLSAFEADFVRWQALLSGLEGEELTLHVWEKSLSGESSFKLTCRLAGEGKAVLVSAETVDGALVSFSVTEEDAKITEGLPFAGSVVLYVVMGLSVALVVLMVLDCIRRKLEAKALWLVLIVGGNFQLIFSGGPSDFAARLAGLALVPINSLDVFSSGAFEMVLVLPVGAIVYFFLRKTMTKICENETQKTLPKE